MKFNWKITTREEFVNMLKLLYVKCPLIVLGVALVCLAIGYPAKLMLGEENGLSQAVGLIFAAVFTLYALTIFGYGVYSLYRGMRAMYNGKKAFDANEDVSAYKLEIHYSLPFAFPIASIGFTPVGIVLAFVLAYMIYKWGLSLYKWSDMKKVLFHKEGTTWKCTMLTWFNFYIFIVASFYPVIVTSIIIGIIYILFKTGVAQGAWEGLTNMVTNTMADAGSSDSFHTCRNCIYYGAAGECAKSHLFMQPNESCSDFRS